MLASTIQVQYLWRFTVGVDAVCIVIYSIGWDKMRRGNERKNEIIK